MRKLEKACLEINDRSQAIFLQQVNLKSRRNENKEIEAFFNDDKNESISNKDSNEEEEEEEEEIEIEDQENVFTPVEEQTETPTGESDHLKEEELNEEEILYLQNTGKFFILDSMRQVDTMF